MSVLGDRFLPPPNPWTTILVACFGLKREYVSESLSSVFINSPFSCVDLKTKSLKVVIDLHLMFNRFIYIFNCYFHEDIEYVYVNRTAILSNIT